MAIKSGKGECSLSRVDERFQLSFGSTDHSPLVYRHKQRISAAEFREDVTTLSERLDKPGDLLISCTGRYGFAVGLIAAWMNGRAVILPPNHLSRTLDNIRQKHPLAFEADEAWEHDLRNDSHLHGEASRWEIELPVSQLGVKLYTSGSTGEPKLVAKTIGNLLWEAETLYRSFHWPNTAVLATVPPHHLYGLTFSLLMPWVGGLPWVDATPLFPMDVMEWIEATDAGTLISVPVQYKAMLAEGLMLDSLVCVSAAAPLSMDLAQAWLRRQFREILEIYGSTETGVVAHRRQVSNPNWQVLEGVEIGQLGELLTVTSPFMSPDYGDRFQSADRIRRTGTRLFQLLGRTDSIVKIGGKRVSLDAIANQLLCCEGVLDAVAIARDTNGPVRDKAIWAALAVADRETFDTQRLRACLRDRLDSIEIPKRLIFVDRLPRTASGKLPRQRIESLFELDEKGSV